MLKFSKTSNKKTDGGFTLIELLVVVLILGILSVIAVVAVNNARTVAIAKSCVASAQSMLKALDAYKIDNNGKAPTNYSDLVPTYLHALPALTTGTETNQDYYLKITTSTPTLPSGGTTTVYTIDGYSDKGTTAIAACASIK